ncbi:MAG: hypothetical protein ACYC0J_07045 [Gammaproteobacteria bacterium]
MLIRNARCEFYARYGHGYEKADPATLNTYVRSKKKHLVGVKSTQFAFSPIGAKSLVKADKTGCYYNAFAFSAYKAALKPRKQEAELTWLMDAGDNYDALLHYQKEMSAYIANGIKSLNLGAVANADNQYPCVLFNFPKDTHIKEADWVNLISIYILAFANKLADERHVNIEIVRRSSFGHLRPTMSECAPSLRISPGIIPLAYADILIEAIKLAHYCLCGAGKALFNAKHAHPTLANHLRQYSEIKEMKPVLTLPDNLWDVLWSPVDAKKYSFVYQLTRKEINFEALINRVMDGMIKSKLNVADIIKNEKIFYKALVSPLVDAVRSFSLIGGKMSFSQTQAQLPDYKWSSDPVALDDVPFWGEINRLADIFEVGQDGWVINHDISAVHAKLEAAASKSMFSPIIMGCKDGYGSDSDCEGDVKLSASSKIHLYGRKRICATGMRAIQLAYGAIRSVYADNANIPKDTEHMYYETAEALKRYSIPVGKVGTHGGFIERLTFFDINHCNTTQAKTPSLVEVISKDSKVCVLDTTSATQLEILEKMEALFAHAKDLQTVMLVGSGLKNEQAGTDTNSYGYVRIFSKSKDTMHVLYDVMTELEKKANYVHPAGSHEIRVNCKQKKLVPTNLGILHARVGIR